MEIRDCDVLLTGATGGIGHALARALAARGAKLLLTGRRSEVLEALADELGARALSVDLADRAALDRLIETATGVDILVANAGLPATGTLDDFTVEEIDRAIDVNLRAAVLLARALAEPMRQRRSGHMVFMSSLAGKAPSPWASVYCATKFGLRGFALSLRADLRDDNVGVSVIYPGPVADAGMFADSGVGIPLGIRPSSPDKVARAVIGAIERNRAEVSVSALPLRAGTALASAAPSVAAVAARRLGADRVARDLALNQRDKR
ncbi:MAG TPA: SDR family NAD(P)-dependent oxidoreductase [Candidatus Dormibacteraeota bacterium]|jgi:short-subunit dehydrogenase|nr:SDR family NAD(P)-dependent oxidoreductase [Candidatus Dormibacteraeota bacterium]